MRSGALLSPSPALHPGCGAAVQGTAAGKHGPNPTEPFAASPAGGRRAQREFRPHAIPEGCSNRCGASSPATLTTAKAGPASPRMLASKEI